MARLKDSFEFVRKEFFPTWDKKKQWLIEKVAEGSRGYCIRRGKTILIFYLPHNENSLYWLLIHEICHAISTNFHGERWKNRMIKVAELSRKKGNSQLSKMIFHDLKELKRRGEEREVS